MAAAIFQPGYPHGLIFLNPGHFSIVDGCTPARRAASRMRIRFARQIMDDVAAVSVGYGVTAAIKTDGSIWTWGENNCGQLGDGTTAASDTPQQVHGLTGGVSDTAGSGPAPEQPAGSPAFTDVAASAYYYTPVQWAVEQGIANGTGNNQFSPEETCTRAQILTFLWRTMGQPEPTIENPFSDAIEDAYYNAALWAYEKGMVTGSTFGSDTPCTRSMTVTYLWQASGSPDTEPSTKFRDVPASADYAQAAAWAVESGITTGDGEGTFAPNDICTRGQIATFLYRTFVSAADTRSTESSAASSAGAASSARLVPVQALSNLDSIRRKMTDEQLAEAYAAAAKIVEKYQELPPEEQMRGIFQELRRMSMEEISYSMSEEHYADPYGFFVLHVASCAGATQAVGLCLNILLPRKKLGKKWRV